MGVAKNETHLDGYKIELIERAEGASGVGLR